MKFSVVIPTRRRPHHLRACLESLAVVEYPRTDFEVIVVDDGGGVPADLIEHARQRLTLRLLTQEHQGPATARNLGVASARGTYVAFTDDDCTVDRNWLRAMETSLLDHPGAIIGGATLSSTGSSVYAVASQEIVDFLYEYYAEAPTRLRFFATNNVACRRDLLLSLGGFDESFPRAAAEDRDLCERWNDAGRPFHFAQQAIATHHLESSLTHYVRQHLRYGQGATHLNRARQKRGHSGPKLEPLSFYFRLVTFSLRRGISLRAMGLAALAFLSQVAYGLGYYSERFLVAARRREAPRPGESTEPAPEPSRAAP